MIPKSWFQSVGAFDPRYAPAYYEDTDLGVQGFAKLVNKCISASERGFITEALVEPI